MKVIKNLADFPINQNTFCTLGNFDGVHLAHQKILKQTVQYAKNKNLASVIVTYHPSPNIVLAKQKDFQYLMTLENRIDYIQKFEPDFLILIDFTKEFSQKTADDFLEILVYQLKAKGILLGFNHCFGKEKKGNFAFLQKNQEKYRYELFQMPKVIQKEDTISSSLIKNFIRVGKVEKANQMLGRYFFIEGNVQEGEKKGRKMNFPTINLHQKASFVYPSKGVYVGKVEIAKKYSLKCMINIGTRPTFTQSDKVLIEAHIFDFSQNIYGEEVRIFFYQKIREEMKFKDMEHLKKQLLRDKEKVLELLD